jgi:hypothetical protein
VAYRLHHAGLMNAAILSEAATGRLRGLPDAQVLA